MLPAISSARRKQSAEEGLPCAIDPDRSEGHLPRHSTRVRQRRTMRQSLLQSTRAALGHTGRSMRRARSVARGVYRARQLSECRGAMRGGDRALALREWGGRAGARASPPGGAFDHDVQISIESIFRLGGGCHPPKLRKNPSLFTGRENERITRV